jgi:N-acetylmuramoyl-L-alanine amidase
VKITGKISTFGGSDDTSGMSAEEDLALYWDDDQVAEHPELFMPGASTAKGGLAWQLNAEAPYVAARWSYEGYEKSELRNAIFVLVAGDNAALCRAVDWGPAETTGRCLDISPSLADALSLATDDTATLYGPVLDMLDLPQRELPERKIICLSAGHSEEVRGASGFIDEFDENVRMVEETARCIREMGHICHTFVDQTSDDQQENLSTITDWHNSHTRTLDCSIHFNASDDPDANGTECFYGSPKQLAASISAAIASAGDFKDRGAKDGSGLFFISHTWAPAVLVETCFVTNRLDCEKYEDCFEAIAYALAKALVTDPSISV